MVAFMMSIALQIVSFDVQITILINIITFRVFFTFLPVFITSLYSYACFLGMSFQVLRHSFITYYLNNDHVSDLRFEITVYSQGDELAVSKSGRHSVPSTRRTPALLSLSDRRHYVKSGLSPPLAASPG